MPDAVMPQVPTGIYPGTQPTDRAYVPLIFVPEPGWGTPVEYRLTHDEAIMMARWLLKQAAAEMTAAGSA